MDDEGDLSFEEPYLPWGVSRNRPHITPPLVTPELPSTRGILSWRSYVLPSLSNGGGVRASPALDSPIEPAATDGEDGSASEMSFSPLAEGSNLPILSPLVAYVPLRGVDSEPSTPPSPSIDDNTSVSSALDPFEDSDPWDDSASELSLSSDDDAHSSPAPEPSSDLIATDDDDGLSDEMPSSLFADSNSLLSFEEPYLPWGVDRNRPSITPPLITHELPSTRDTLSWMSSFVPRQPYASDSDNPRTFSASNFPPFISQPSFFRENFPGTSDSHSYLGSWRQSSYYYIRKRTRDSEDPYLLHLDGFGDLILNTEFRLVLRASLAKLPTELIPLIIDFLLNPISRRGSRDPEVRSTLSRTGLVCRSWSIIQRKKLFADLKLDSSGDVRFLLAMLRGPRNPWLPAAVTDVSLHVPPTSMESSLELLIDKLPSLCKLNLVFHPRQPAISLVSLPFRFVFCSTLKHVRLGDVTPESLSVLADLFERMENLQEIEIVVKAWANPPEGPPTRMSLSSFPRLRYIRCLGENTGMLIWLYAPFLARHYNLRLEDVTSSNSDVKLAILLTKHLIAILTKDRCHSYGYSAVLIGTDTIQIKVFRDYTCRLSFVCEALLWPPDRGRASVNEGRPVIRNIKLLDCEGKLVDQEKDISLAPLDSCFAVVAIETITIYGSYAIGAFEKRLPKLWKLGKLCVKAAAKWDGTCSRYEKEWGDD